MDQGTLPFPAAQPVAFADTIGLFMPAGDVARPARLAVLFASPWGLEEMSFRKLWRVTAEKLSALGIPSLRFDYPGTGDALDPAGFDAGLAVWSESLTRAARQLKALSGCGHVAIVAAGLGTVVASKAAADLDGLEAMAFLAPVISGRSYLRELAMWSSVVDDNLGLAPDQRSRSGTSIASLHMPDPIADELRRIDLKMLERAPAGRILVGVRPDRPADLDLGRRLRVLGADVAEVPFDNYQDLVGNPTISTLPLSLADDVVTWISAMPVDVDKPSKPPAFSRGRLVGPHFAETPVRFGAGDHLVGVLCEPAGLRRGAAVLLLSAAYDRHAGWGRHTVGMARQLAREGIASLRFDTANVADSPAYPGRPQQVLYHDSQIGDVTDALDFLERGDFGRILVAGRCSGAFLAFRSALADRRIAGVVAVNPIVFRWQPGRSVDDAIVNGTRSLEDYGRRAFDLATLRRVLAGEVDVFAAVSNIGKGLARRVSGRVMHAFRFSLPEGREIRDAFEALHRRRVPVSLVYSDGDIGLEHYDYYFGRDGRALAQWPGVTTGVIARADHNLTPPEARQAYLDTVRDMALRLVPQTMTASEPKDAVAAE